MIYSLQIENAFPLKVWMTFVGDGSVQKKTT